MSTYLEVRAAAVAIFVALLAAAPIASGATYYVSPNGSDTLDGSPETPWATIDHAAGQLNAGDRIVVRPGVYREAVVLNRSGSEGAPITIQGLPDAVLESPDPTQSLSAFDLGDSTHVRIEGFELRGGFGETVYVRPGATDIDLDNLDIHDNRNGIWISGAKGVRIQRVSVHDNGQAAVRIFNGADDITITDTVSEHNSDGAGCDGDADGFSVEADVSNLRFERVSAIGNSEDGFDIKAPNPVLLQVISSANGCTGMKLWNGAYVENALVEGSPIGIKAGGSPDAAVVLQNVTIADNATGIRGSGNTYDLILWNSIVSGPGKALSYDAGVQVVEDYNILFRPQNGPLIERLDGVGGVDFTVDDVCSGRWQVDSGQGTHTLVLDPEFEGADDRGLGPTSPALDSGATGGAPSTDLLGVARPSNRGIDRGATSAPTMTPPCQFRPCAWPCAETGETVSASARYCSPMTSTLPPPGFP